MSKTTPGRLAAAAAASVLAGCAASYVPVSGGAVDEARLERDLATCEAAAAQQDPLADTALGFLGGAFWGAAEGVSIGIVHGGVGVGEGAAVGAAAGAVLGTLYGAAVGNQGVEEAMERCMSSKGYAAE